MMKAAEKGNIPICEALIRAGSDPFVVDKMNRRADEHARSNGHHIIKEMLVNFIN